MKTRSEHVEEDHAYGNHCGIDLTCDSSAGGKGLPQRHLGSPFVEVENQSHDGAFLHGKHLQHKHALRTIRGPNMGTHEITHRQIKTLNDDKL